MVLTPRTSTSWTSRTSIATPDSSSPEDSVLVESEMELALEMVNHLPPAVVGSLFARLGEIEEATLAAEERASRAADIIRAAAEGTLELMTPPLAPEVEGTAAPRPWLTLLLLLAAAVLGCTLAAFALEGRGTSLEVELVQVQHHLGAGGCWDMLSEAQGDVEELRTHLSDLEAGYNTALEAISSWVGFLRSATGSHTMTTGERSQYELKSSELETLCMQAARPGREALEAIGQLPRPGHHNSSPAVP